VKAMKNDSTIKIIVVAALSIVALWFLKAILFPAGYGVSVNYRMPTYMRNGSEHGYNYSYGVNNFNGSGTLLVAFLIKVLIIVLVIALLVGLVIFIKNHVFTQEDIASMKNTFTGKQSKANNVCSVCGKKLNEEWKVCPHCGKEVDKL
jgi:hypothetical protein